MGVIGAVGAGFEVYSLNISRERHIENESGISEAATGIAQLSALTAGVAGLGYGALVFESDKTFADYLIDGPSAVITFSNQTNKDALKEFASYFTYSIINNYPNID